MWLGFVLLLRKCERKREKEREWDKKKYTTAVVFDGVEREFEWERELWENSLGFEFGEREREFYRVWIWQKGEGERGQLDKVWKKYMQHNSQLKKLSYIS